MKRLRHLPDAAGILASGAVVLGGIHSVEWFVERGFPIENVASATLPAAIAVAFAVRLAGHWALKRYFNIDAG